MLFMILLHRKQNKTKWLRYFKCSPLREIILGLKTNTQNECTAFVCISEYLL